MSPGTNHGVEVFVFQGGRFLGSRCFTQRTIVVGSAHDANLRLRHASIAARHAILRIEGDSLVLANNSASVPVLVNGQDVSVRKVHAKDDIRIGPFRVKVSLLDDANQGFGTDSNQAQAGPARVGPSVDTANMRAAKGRSPSGSARQHTEYDRRPPGGSRATPSVPPLRSSSHEQDPYAYDGDRGRLDDFDEDAPTRLARRPSANVALAPTDRFDSAPAQQDAYRPSALDAERIAANVDRAAEAVRPPDLDQQANREQTIEPAADRALSDEDEDEDDDEEEFVEPFSLLENIVRERFKTPTESERHAMVEVVRYRDGEILDLLRADPGQRVQILPDDFKLIQAHDDGHARVFFRDDFKGSVVRAGKSRPLKRMVRPDTLVNRRKKIYAIELREGDFAQIVREDAGYLVRFVKPPRVPQPRIRFRLNWNTVQVLAGSATFHFLLLVLLGFTAPDANLYTEPEAERFAKVTMKELKLDKPKEEPKPEPEQPPEPPPVKDEKVPKPKAKPTRERGPRRPQTPQQRARAQKTQVANVLTALQTIKPAGSPGRSDLKSLVTNIAAVRVPGGSSSSFKVSGVIGKIPGNAIRLAGGGHGGKETKIGRQLLAGTKIGNVAALAGTGTRVRGRARKAPTRAIKATGGSLSREAIQKVVGQHMSAIQACYERQLLTNRGLAGKIVFDWVISTSGDVGSARQVSSSLGNIAVSTCILREIRTWQFPKPVGGSVSVRYPFVFRVQGF